MIQREESDEMVKNGWIRAWMMFEVLAISEETTKNSLESLVNKLEKDARVKVYGKSFGSTKKVEKPMPSVEFGYSLTCEIELVSPKLDNLAQVVTEYGPSAIELLEPSKISVDSGEAQAILNSISMIMHDFAAAGAGGIVFLKGEK
ncbi:MAG: hypothetical protein V1678_00580 [Candidatus Aenigmatarchaeota archaeon]